MKGFVTALKSKLDAGSDSFVLKTFEDIGDYTVSDCTAPVLSRLAEDLEKYQLGDIYSVEGKNVQGEQYMEFYADEEALDALILELFYAQKK